MRQSDAQFSGHLYPGPGLCSSQHFPLFSVLSAVWYPSKMNLRDSRVKLARPSFPARFL